MIILVELFSSRVSAPTAELHKSPEALLETQYQLTRDMAVELLLGQGLIEGPAEVLVLVAWRNAEMQIQRRDAGNANYRLASPCMPHQTPTWPTGY